MFNAEDIAVDFYEASLWRPHSGLTAADRRAWDEALFDRTPKAWTVHYCKVCGVRFEETHGRGRLEGAEGGKAKTVFCSKVCSRIHDQARKDAQRAATRIDIECICTYCGLVFMNPPRRGRKARKFCSRQHKDAAKWARKKQAA